MPSRYFSNSQPSLDSSDAGRADHAHVADALLRAGRVEQVLEESDLDVAPDEGGLERVRAAAAAALRDDSKRAPRLDRRALALEGLLARGLERDRDARGAEGRLANEHGAGCGGGLESGGRVHEVARDHALVLRRRG